MKPASERNKSYGAQIEVAESRVALRKSVKRDDQPTPYEGDIMAFAHSLATDLFEGGFIDRTTMREIDDLALTPVKDFGPDEIRVLREAAGLSQAVLARMLNVTSSSVSQWERGEKHPSGSVLKLLSLAHARGIRAIM